MAEARKFDHPKMAKEVNPILQSRSARTGKIQDNRNHDRQIKKATQLSSSNPCNVNSHPTLKNVTSDPSTRKKPLDFKEKQCLDYRKVKSHSATKKPPFIVPGKIHHIDYFCQSVDKHLPPRFKRTKSANGSKPVQHLVSASQYTTGSDSTASRSGSSFASKDSVFTAPAGLSLPKPVETKLSDTASTAEDVGLSPLGIMTPLNERDTPGNLHLSPLLKSNPWITKERGWAARNEQIENSLSNSTSPPSNRSVPKICLHDKTLNESEIQEECSKPQTDMESTRVAQHFQEILKQEDERLKNLCQKWDQILDEEQVPGTEMGAVFTVVGQAQLLQRERFCQFAELINQFETKTGEKEITATDLEGFWEMIYIQVSDVDRKFINLNELRANNWVRKEEIKPEVISKKFGTSKKKMKAPPVRPVSAKSSLRAHIAAARKKMNSKTPLKSPSFCVRLTPPLRSPSDFRRMSSKLAEELLTNQMESSQTETPPTTNISEIYVEERVHSLVDDVVGVFKLTTRKKHNSARYFPSITPQRPTRKRSSTADQINVEQLSKLTLSSGPLKDLKKNLTPIPTTVPSPADQSMSDLSEMRSELNSVSCVEDSTGYSSEPEILEVKPAITRQNSFYHEEINNNVEQPMSQKKKIVPAPFESMMSDGSLDVESP